MDSRRVCSCWTTSAWLAASSAAWRVSRADPADERGVGVGRRLGAGAEGRGRAQAGDQRGDGRVAGLAGHGGRHDERSGCCRSPG